MHQELFLELLDTYVDDARLRFNLPGKSVAVGAGTEELVIRVHRPRMFRRLLTHGNLGLGEAYIDQDFELERGTLANFLHVLLRNRLDQRLKRTSQLAIRMMAVRLANAWRGSRRNVRRHYDLGDDLFEAFLDPTMTYSCGYACTPEDSLEQLQVNKLDRICRKLRLQPEERLLDIGCGYGGLLIYAARQYGVSGYGVTTSRQHWARGNANIARAGLSQRLRIDCVDYSAVSGQFDKVVSVGMMEHLPRRAHAGYVRTIARALTPQGMGLVHMIGCTTRHLVHDPFVQTYVFPASSQVRLSDLAAELERQHLVILDLENIAQHYAYTVRRWYEGFQANRMTLDPTRYDERFMRLWEYYLCCGIAAASVPDAAVYQVLFMRNQSPLPPLRRLA